MTSPKATALMRASGGLMVLAVLLAWFNCFSGEFLYDDVPAILGNPSIRGIGSAFSPGRNDLTVSGRPLGNLSLAINYALGGTTPWGYHALNLLIHLGAGAALFGIIRRTLVRPALREHFGEAAPWLALTVAALWLVHPLQTESVTYVIQRVESLMGLCYLVTLYCFIRGAESARPGPWHAAAVAACLAGMASKEVMVSAPLFVLLYDRTFFSPSFGEALRRRGRFYAGLAFTWLPLIYWVASTGGRGGSAGFGGPVTWSDYALLQFPAIVHYLRLCFWPSPLVFDYGILPSTTLAQVAPQAALVLALAVAAAIAVWRAPAVGLLGAWFWMILSPSSSVVPVGTETMAEHRMYLPLAAVVLLVVLGCHRLLGWRVAVPLFAAVAVGFAGLTAQRNRDYASAFAIWSDTVAKVPGNPRAQNDLGSLWLERGNLPEAERCFTRALQLEPHYASAHYNLGIVQERTARDAEAVGHFLTAIQLEESFADARVNLGNLLLKLGRAAEAVPQYEAAIRQQPDSADLHHDLGLALAALGRSDEAIVHFETAVRLQPDFAAAHAALGSALLRRGRVDDAVRSLQTAVRLDSQRPQPFLDLAEAAARRGDLASAERDFRTAVRLQPGLAVAHFYLGGLLAQMNRFPEAIAEFQSALQLEPDNLEGRKYLAQALLVADRLDEATVQYRLILRARPDDPDALAYLRQARAVPPSFRRTP